MSRQRGREREELLHFTQASISLRWLALGALIAQEALSPGPSSRTVPLPLYSWMLAYTLALTLYAWRYPARAGSAAKWAIPLDLSVIVIGLLLTGFPEPFLFLGFLVAVISGLLLGHTGAAAVAAIVGIAQFPALRTSVFAPDRYLTWGIGALSLLATGSAAAVAAAHLAARERSSRVFADIKDLAQTSGDPAAVLTATADQFRASSGSLMLFDPRTERLEILAAHQLNESYRQAQPRLRESIAGWVLQEGQPVLLTPGAAVPFRLSRTEIGSSICIPLLVGHRPLGILNLNRTVDARLFTLADLDAADLIAQLAVGILQQVQHERAFAAALHDLAEGFSEVSRALARDPAVLWPVLLDIARSLSAAQFAVLALEREDSGVVDIVAFRGIDGATARQFLPTLLAASTQNSIRMTNGQTSGSGAPATVACVPLRVAARTIGALGLGFPDGTGAPDRLLEAVAAHVAAAVHTARAAHRVADVGVAEERRRIAREMHDGLAQTIADALLQTDLSAMAAQTNTPRLGEDLKELRTLLERAMRELREFLSELRRQDEVEGGLFAAAEALGKEFGRRHEIATSVVVQGDDAHLPSAVRHAVLAIVRQALTNVRSHAQATSVTIRVEVNEQACRAGVTDNGVGFDLAAYRARPPVAHHLGLTSMEERASLVGGRLEIDTAPGRGTTVAAHIPLGRDHG